MGIDPHGWLEPPAWAGNVRGVDMRHLAALGCAGFLAVVGIGCGGDRSRVASWEEIANQEGNDLVEVEVGGEFWATAPSGRPDAVVIRDRKQLDPFMRVFGRRDLPRRLKETLEQGGTTVLRFRFGDGTIATAAFHYEDAGWVLGDELSQFLWERSQLRRDVDGLRRLAKAASLDQVRGIVFSCNSQAIAKLDGRRDARAVAKLLESWRKAEPHGPAFDGTLNDEIIVTHTSAGEPQRASVKVDFARLREMYSPEVEKVTIGVIEGLWQR